MMVFWNVWYIIQRHSDKQIFWHFTVQTGTIWRQRATLVPEKTFLSTKMLTFLASQRQYLFSVQVTLCPLLKGKKKKVSYLYAGESCAVLDKWRIFHYLVIHMKTSTGCLPSAGPHRTGRVRQHAGDRVIEKWDGGVTSCWSENIARWHGVRPSGLGAPSDFFFPGSLKIYDTRDDSPAVSRGMFEM